jgi:hypothetical protein
VNRGSKERAPAGKILLVSGACGRQKIFLAESLQLQNKLCSMKSLQRIAKKVFKQNQAC